MERLRTLCLALPEAAEKEAWGVPTFRVKDKMFAVVSPRDGISVWVKAPEGAQEFLTEADPDRFFKPPYLGPKGWVGIMLDPPPDWHEVDAHVRRSYQLVAPKKLAAAMG
ncbi:MAG: MmcQ/YjbR family DNA-binding protein [Pseudomonadota bacterium]